ncbi:tyrosinase-like protein 2 [Mytilus californianus]|uniref:tyrosinase-like protein 2 n=1 Tax=Mytilus californianus TaxID=6549 RepID=UPI002245F8E7|nr:tyrosinase-like protein 2 [Mytilus californianus]
MTHVLLFFLSALLNQAVLNGEDIRCIMLSEINFADCNQDLSREYFCSLTLEQQTWLQSLWKAALQDRSTPIRKRREIRTLTATERSTFFSALNNLKNDTTVKPNKFDTLALIHSNRTLCSAHRGSNFLGWHRVYLLLFETAIRQQDDSVTLPYWDSVLDNQNITDPRHTVIFTDQFLGNGDGIVDSGPFKHWLDINNCPLQRKVSRIDHTELPSPDIINMIENDIKVHHVADVIDHLGKAEQALTIEGQHNLPHEWVGGTMDVLNSSARDPTFILHHAFIDYVWEKFRQKQERLGENPEFYPPLGKTSKTDKYNLTSFHTADRTMDCFPWMENKDGYRSNFVGILYEYEESPQCPNCGKSKYLTCNKKLNRCIGSVPKDSVKGHLWAIIIIIGVIVVAIIIVFCLLKKRYSKKDYTRF